MTIRQTRWMPDTCGCSIIYQWDDALSEALRAHVLSGIEVACPAHNGMASQSIYDTCLRENQGKNKAVQGAVNSVARLRTTVLNADGTSSNVLAPGVTPVVTWSGTGPARTMSLAFTGATLTATEKTTIRTWLAANLLTLTVTVL